MMWHFLILLSYNCLYDFIFFVLYIHWSRGDDCRQFSGLNKYALCQIQSCGKVNSPKAGDVYVYIAKNLGHVGAGN